MRETPVYPHSLPQCMALASFLIFASLIGIEWNLRYFNLYFFFLVIVEFEHLSLFKRFYLFLEKGEGREKGRETSVCDCLLVPPTGDLACNPGMCHDWELNRWPLVCRPAVHPLSHTSQGRVWASLDRLLRFWVSSTMNCLFILFAHFILRKVLSSWC